MITKKYIKIYNSFIDKYKMIHLNPWHEINESNLKLIYDELTNNIDVDDDYSFSYFINYIIKKLSGKVDAHTFYSNNSFYPINYRIINDSVLINFPESLKGSELLSINGIDINYIIGEIENIITYGTQGKRIYELEKSLMNKMILFGLPIFRNSSSLKFKICNMDGCIINKEIYKEEKYESNEKFDVEKYMYGEPGKYKIIEKNLIINHSSVQNKFENQIKENIARIKQEDLSNVERIIVDLRGNTGGNSNLNKPLLDFLKEYPEIEMVTLTDYRIFSSGRYALCNLKELGSITIGEEISTPINCYGNNSWISIDGYNFGISERYFHPLKKIAISSKDDYEEKITKDILEPVIFKPDIYVFQNKEDYRKGIDSILEYALTYSNKKNKTL